MVRGPVPVVFASYFILFSICLSAASVLLCTSHIREGLLIAPQYGGKVRKLLIYEFGTPNTALYALAPNHVFGQ